MSEIVAEKKHEHKRGRADETPNSALGGCAPRTGAAKQTNGRLKQQTANSAGAHTSKCGAQAQAPTGITPLFTTLSSSDCRTMRANGPDAAKSKLHQSAK